MFPPLSMCMKSLYCLTFDNNVFSSQDSNISTFSRSSVRSSKRLKGMGETGYTKPGPPTPGRNKSLGKSTRMKLFPEPKFNHVRNSR